MWTLGNLTASGKVDGDCNQLSCRIAPTAKNCAWISIFVGLAFHGLMFV